MTKRDRSVSWRTKRYPLDPVMALCRQDKKSLADRAGVSVHAVDMWQTDGIKWLTADRLAVNLGYHPCEFWPDWFDDVTDEKVPL